MADEQNDPLFPNPQVVITQPSAGQVMTSGYFSIKGYDGSIWVNAYKVLSNNTLELLGGSVTPGGYWEVPVFFTDGSYTICVGLESNMSERVTFSVRVAFTVPRITLPRDEEIDISQPFTVGGTATPGFRVRIMTQGGWHDFGLSEPAARDGSWSKTLDIRNLPDTITIQAAHDAHGQWSEARTFRLRASKPIIQFPENGDITDVKGRISGAGGVSGAIVEVLKDFEHSFKIGEGDVGANGEWNVKRFVMDMPPGPFSIVARQIVGTVPSDVSEVRSFKIRPPALTAVTTSYPTETSLKFSGSGHTGATVEITIVSGPGGTAPSAVPVTGGRWETTATNWPFGTYNLKAIQKVSDNANGWIESQPYAFTVNRELPNPSDVVFTIDYQPTFSGKGYTGATVKLYNQGGGSLAAPDARVSSGQWSSRASEVWGPTLNREVHINQHLDNQHSPDWIILKVTIPPLAPVIGQVQEDGLSPKISGTCWSDAMVELTFSDAPTTKHPATVTGTNWSFQRGTPFAPDVPHIVTVTQFVAGQTSASASVTFTVYTPMLKPLIFEPEPSSQVGRDVTVKGRSGMAGASMQLRDVVSGRDLGEPKLLIAGGDWSIDLTVLEFREYTADAQQTLNQRESERSDMLKFEVVLLPPVFTQPTESGDQPRTATLEGEGMPLGRVEVWLAGDTGPLLRNIPVDSDGHWKAEVTLPVGAKIIWARQTFDGQISKDSPPLNYNVVPAAPYIETPALDEHIGRRVVISGFGVPGDRVTVKLGGAVSKVLGRSPVLEDRTWSVTVMLNLPGGRYGLVAVASCDGFESADSPERSVVLGAFLPSIDVPAAGRWVSDPVRFEGQGKPGIGQLMSWFNSERIVSSDVPVSPTGWQCNATWPFPGGGNWCRFKQTLTDPEEGGTVSDWADSHRFQVWPASPTKA
jgi:hypothetical protein